MTMMATTDTDIRTKLLATIDARVEQEGTFSALVAAFGNVDRGGDRIMPGAFTASLAEWRASGKRIPIIWHHKAEDPSMIIGSADPAQSHETPEGLVLVGRLNIERSAAAAQVRDLLMNGDMSGWSFGYGVKRARRAAGGVTELLELDLLEAGPTPMPMNRSARTLSVKGEQVPEREPEPPLSHTEIEERLAREGIIGPIVASVDQPEADNEDVREGAREAMAFVLGFRRNGDEQGKAVPPPWVPDPDTYTDAQWARACVLDLADSDPTLANASAKQRWRLPVRRPGATKPDRAGLDAAARRLVEGSWPVEVKRRAAQRLVDEYAAIGEPIVNRYLLALGNKSTTTRTKSTAPITIAEFGC